MARIELYDNADEAKGARDHYNHNLNRRAVVAKVPDDPVDDFGGGPREEVFQADITSSRWMLIVED
ncbi:hypothetical protein DWB84_03465 [Saccharophagus sp. K07]|jgi:hypothetical protein|uniref:hypothetical protein n=1 Tax=Saccharophagus sp. K07 TaxID=2283636 RepID=UPI001651C173|nr:hypothetical protein [Saccharophagus sp. K07]MBC6904524.1 hypothetical protein [Saccharophagus sp. K07]